MKSKKMFTVLFYAYIFFIFIKIFNSSGVAGVYDLPYYRKIIECSNLIPFSNLGSIRSIFVSFIMYMPLSFLSRECYSYFNDGKCFFSFIVLFIILHEIVQVFSLKGYLDINDIIIGSLGAMLAYWTIDFIKKNIPNK